MIVATPSYIITYHAINKKGQHEDGVMLSPTKDLEAVLKRDGYKNVEIVNVRPPNKLINLTASRPQVISTLG